MLSICNTCLFKSELGGAPTTLSGIIDAVSSPGSFVDSIHFFLGKAVQVDIRLTLG